MAVGTSRDSAVCINAILVVFVVEALLFWASAGWAKGAQDKVAGAKATFQAKCVMCHGPDGAGSEVGKSMNIPDLRSAAAQKLSNAELAQIISDGKAGMPAFKSSLSEAQIHSLVTYIRSLHQKK